MPRDSHHLAIYSQHTPALWARATQLSQRHLTSASTQPEEPNRPGQCWHFLPPFPRVTQWPYT